MEVDEGNVNVSAGANQGSGVANFLEDVANSKSGEMSASPGNVANQLGKGVNVPMVYVTPPPPPSAPLGLPGPNRSGQTQGSVDSAARSMPQGSLTVAEGMPFQAVPAVPAGRQVVSYADMTPAPGGIFGTAGLVDSLNQSQAPQGAGPASQPSPAEVRAARKLRLEQEKAARWVVRMDMLKAAAGDEETFKTDLLDRLPKADRESGKITEPRVYLDLCYSRDFDKTLEEYETSKWKKYSEESKTSERVKSEVRDLFIKAARGEFTLKAKEEKEAKKVAKAKQQAAERRKRKEVKDDKAKTDDKRSKDKKKDDDVVFLPGTSKYAPKSKSSKTSGETSGKRKHSSDGSNQPPSKRPSTSAVVDLTEEEAGEKSASDIVTSAYKAKYSMQLKEVVINKDGQETLRDVGRDVWEGPLNKKFRKLVGAAQDEAMEAEEESQMPQFHDIDFLNGKVYIVPTNEFTKDWVFKVFKDLTVGHSKYRPVMTAEVATSACFNVTIKTAVLPEDLNKAWKRTVFLSGLPKGETKIVSKEPVDKKLTRIIFAASKNAIKTICKADKAKMRRAGDINFGCKDLTVHYFRDPVTSLDLDKAIRFNYDA